jgi:CheY-specific phosphatase CheX
MAVAIHAAFESMHSVFEHLLGARVDRLPSAPESAEKPSLVCAIPMMGDVHGVLQIAMGERLLHRCLRAITGDDSNDPGALIDVCGEVGNMLAGRLACAFDADSSSVEFFAPMISPHPISALRASIETTTTTVLAVASAPTVSGIQAVDDATDRTDFVPTIDCVWVSLVTMKGAESGPPDRG